MTITAKVIKYSKGPTRYHPPILTVEARYPRFIHSELMTHRVFSRNAASSRAIKTEKLIQSVLDDPAMPTFWGANQAGMQAAEECNESVRLSSFASNALDPSKYDGYEIWSKEEYGASREDAWLVGRDNAVELARAFNEAGYHKQIVNRILEPWAHITVCITSTSWANFFALRDHPAAQPEIQVLARAIHEAKEAATPEILDYHQWHLPYVTNEEKDALKVKDQIKLSVARCASTSYKTVDGQEMTIEKAIALNDKLLASEPLHASPAEHQAHPDHYEDFDWNGVKSWAQPGLHGNFEGYVQYRKTLRNEYVQDII